MEILSNEILMKWLFYIYIYIHIYVCVFIYLFILYVFIYLTLSKRDNFPFFLFMSRINFHHFNKYIKIIK